MWPRGNVGRAQSQETGDWCLPLQQHSFRVLLQLPRLTFLICETKKSDWIISKVLFNSNKTSDSRTGGLGNIRSDWRLDLRKANNYPYQFSITATLKLSISYKTIIYDFSLFCTSLGSSVASHEFTYVNEFSLRLAGFSWDICVIWASLALWSFHPQRGYTRLPHSWR